ncbi:MAG: hypothetical protein KGI27_13475 [Thaumarchaeota archaeon]|nr:hypothetical protein [Nitrososphaerota archaeon]
MLSLTGTGSSGVASGVAISRTANAGATWLQIYSGLLIPNYLDVGDGLATNLSPSATYQWKIQDVATPAVSGLSNSLSPSSQLTLVPDLTSETLRRLLQAAIQSVVPPAGYKTPQLLFVMPLDATPQLPFAVLSLDLAQQDEVPIGLGIAKENFAMETLSAESGTNSAVWNVSGMQSRRYSLHLFTRNYLERDWWQDALVGILYGLQGLFARIGIDNQFSYQITQGAVTGDEAQPGFYYAQVEIDTKGVSTVQIQAQIGNFDAIIVDVSTATSDASGTSGLIINV